ncbi:hypothetical protein RRG08_008779 [Elysia crispata]|uniref:Uncharacterized protein n=1 Tax=Elysia crispata TaxID=231223 RepID=A0AAE1DBF8_9GAST|nr:hypothetical protein RRG08_008779 [Elysia crispata]
MVGQDIRDPTYLTSLTVDQVLQKAPLSQSREFEFNNLTKSNKATPLIKLPDRQKAPLSQSREFKFQTLPIRSPIWFSTNADLNLVETCLITQLGVLRKKQLGLVGRRCVVSKLYRRAADIAGTLVSLNPRPSANSVGGTVDEHLGGPGFEP